VGLRKYYRQHQLDAQGKAQQQVPPQAMAVLLLRGISLPGFPQIPTFLQQQQQLGAVPARRVPPADSPISFCTFVFSTFAFFASRKHL